MFLCCKRVRLAVFGGVTMNVLLSRIGAGIVFLFSHLFLFFLVFDVAFAGIEFVTTARVAFMLLVFFYWRRAWIVFVACFRRLPLFFVNLLLLVSYSLVLALSNDSPDNVIFSRFFWFFCYSILSGFLVAAMFGFDVRRLLIGFLVVMAAQSFFVYLSLFFEEYRVWVSENIVNSSNIDFLARFRSPGFSSTGGADLSVKLALGACSSLMLFSQEESLLKRAFCVFSFFFIFGATFFVGRTGMLVAVFFMGAIFFRGLVKFDFRKASANLAIATLVGGCALLFAMFFIERLIFSIGDVFEWAVYSLILNEDKTIETLVGQLEVGPRLDFFSIVLGTGRVVSSSGLNFSGSDSGYVQTIFATGIFFSLSFYLSLLLFFWALVRPRTGPCFFSFLLILVCFIAEIKEPFIFKYTLPMFTFCYLLCVKTEYKALRFSEGFVGKEYSPRLRRDVC